MRSFSGLISEVPPRRIASFGLMIVFGLVLVGCGEENTYVAPPPPKVTVALPVLEEVTDYLEFTGTTEAAAHVDIPARVPGTLEVVHFEPGSPVQAGDLLFTIDPQEYQAEVAIAEANLAQTQAVQTDADKSLERAKALLSRGNVSQASFDEAQAKALTAAADVKAAQANLQKARIDLGYTSITAPISGRVGRNFVDVGNLVGSGDNILLADITTYDPIYVIFTLNELDLLEVLARFRAEMESAGLDPDSPAGQSSVRLPLEMALSNENGFPRTGFVDYAESAVDPDTGTMQVRGIFQNPGAIPQILPGLFTRVRMALGSRPDLPLVAEQAVGSDQGGQFLLVVNDENTVEKRPVRLGALIDGLRVIEEGITPQDRVVVNGTQRARPGAPVEPSLVEMSSLRISVRFADAANAQ